MCPQTLLNWINFASDPVRLPKPLILAAAFGKFCPDRAPQPHLPGSFPFQINNKECKCPCEGYTAFHAFVCCGKLDLKHLLLREGFLCPEERICCSWWGRPCDRCVQTNTHWLCLCVHRAGTSQSLFCCPSLGRIWGAGGSDGQSLISASPDFSVEFCGSRLVWGSSLTSFGEQIGDADVNGVVITQGRLSIPRPLWFHCHCPTAKSSLGAGHCVRVS